MQLALSIAIQNLMAIRNPPAVQLALSMARPGKDLIHFVTVVQSLMHDTAGQELCARYTHMAKSLLADTEVNVLVGVGGVRS